MDQGGVEKHFQSAGNVRDAASKEENLPLAASQVDAATLVTDVNADRKQFLRYPKSSPLAEAGENKSPAGAPPLE
jgi:hypothetical protein